MMNSRQQRTQVLEDRFGLKTAATLSAGAAILPHDISERLRTARLQAVSARKVVKTQTATQVMSSGASATLSWGSSSDERLGWWGRIGTVLPLIALVVGMLAINAIQDDNRTQELAEVDSALLTDVLPPAAFADPGFLQYLKATREVTTVQ